MGSLFANLGAAGSFSLFCLAMALLAWHTPLDIEGSGKRMQLTTLVVNVVLLPLIEAIGRIPVMVVFIVAALLGAAKWLGLSFPSVSLPERSRTALPEASGPVSRKRALSGVGQASSLRASSEADLAAVGRQVKEQEDRETDELFRQIDEMYAAGATFHGEHVDPIAIVRKKRDKSRDWSTDRSHFGGLPRLGKSEWPRDAKGIPLPFIAQIDLAEIAEANPDTPLPKIGSLAFFINSGAVIHVPDGVREHADLPWDLPEAFQETSYPLPEYKSEVTGRTFPFWPVEPLRLRLPASLPAPCDDYEVIEEIVQAQDAALEELVPLRRGQYSSRDLPEEFHWYAADLVLRQIKASIDYLPRAIASAKKYDAASIPQIEEQARGLAQFIPHFAIFVEGRNPWERMSDEEAAVLLDAIEQVHEDYGKLCRYNVSRRPRDLREATYRRMITGDRDAAAAMPDEVLEYYNECDRRSSPYAHQMFGVGGCPQDALYCHLSDNLLLQIAYDTPPEFRFGDVGVWQFWISPENLAAGNWDKAELTFECS